MPEPVVVKVGGSLYDLPDLGARLSRWLDTDARVAPPAPVLLVPGGGAAADVVRNLDRRHGLGEEAAHWLALRALGFNAHFLAALLGAPVVQEYEPRGGRVQVLDAFAFLRADEERHGTATIPHSWEATADTVAARVAVAVQGRRLVLLKSVTVPSGDDWEAAAREGFVDPLFASVVRTSTVDLEVRTFNLRNFSP